MRPNKGLVYALVSGWFVGLATMCLGTPGRMHGGFAFALLLCGVSAAMLAVIADDEARR